MHAADVLVLISLLAEPLSAARVLTWVGLLFSTNGAHMLEHRPVVRKGLLAFRALEWPLLQVNSVDVLDHVLGTLKASVAIHTLILARGGG